MRGGGGIRPPYHTFVIPRKKLMGKVANFFLTFPKYENGRLGATFFSQITFSVVGRVPKWSNLPKFHKGGPCREQQEGKMTNQNRWQVIPVAHNFLVIFLLKYLSLGKIWRWEPFMGQSFQKNLPKSPAHLFLHALFSRPVSSRQGWKRPVQGILRISIEGNSWSCKIFSLYFYNCFNRTPFFSSRIVPTWLKFSLCLQSDLFFCFRTLFFLVLYRPHMVEDDQSNDESLDEDKCHRLFLFRPN